MSPGKIEALGKKQDVTAGPRLFDHLLRTLEIALWLSPLHQHLAKSEPDR